MDWWTTSDATEIERVLAALKSRETINSQKFRDQWTRVEKVSENDYAIFDGQTSDFTIDGVPYKDFKGYGKNNLGFGFFMGSLGTAIELKGGHLVTYAHYMKTSLPALKYYSANQNYTGNLKFNRLPMNLSKIGSVVGGVTFGLSTWSDIQGVYNNAVTPEVATYNFTLGLAAVTNPYFGIPYGLSEAFVPGGFASVIKAYAETQSYHIEMSQKYWWYPIPMIH